LPLLENWLINYLLIILLHTHDLEERYVMHLIMPVDTSQKFAFYGGKVMDDVVEALNIFIGNLMGILSANWRMETP
jgi:hypothetical protein